MTILMTKKEFEDFAIEALKQKYDKLIPEDMETIVEHKYSGEVEIELRKRETQ